MRKDHKKYELFTINLKTLMKRWDLSNRKMAELLDMNASNVDTLRRSVTQPSVTVLLKLESLTGIAAKTLFETPVDYNDYPIQPILNHNMVEEPTEPYLITKPLSEMPMSEFFNHVEQLTMSLLELKKEFEEFREEKG